MMQALGFPSDPVYDPANSALVNVEFARNRALAQPSGVESPDIFSSVTTALGKTVVSLPMIFGRKRFQMVRANAGRVVASMVDLPSARNASPRFLVRHSVRSPTAVLPRRDQPVSGDVLGSAPLPATRFRNNIPECYLLGSSAELAKLPARSVVPPSAFDTPGLVSNEAEAHASAMPVVVALAQLAKAVAICIKIWGYNIHCSPLSLVYRAGGCCKHRVGFVVSLFYHELPMKWAIARRTRRDKQSKYTRTNATDIAGGTRYGGS